MVISADPVALGVGISALVYLSADARVRRAPYVGGCGLPVVCRAGLQRLDHAAEGAAEEQGSEKGKRTHLLASISYNPSSSPVSPVYE